MKTKNAALFLSALAATGDYDIHDKTDEWTKKKKPKQPKYLFNEEELDKLASFENIKEKKKYIKELKRKYEK